MTQFKLCVFELLTLASLAAAPRLAHGAESYGNCTGFIASVPAVISTPGTWCFNQNLSTAITSGTAISVNTDNVTIDCNDYKLDGLAAGAATQTYGVRAVQRLHATVRHCNIRGFWQGLIFLDITGTAGGHVVEDNRFDRNTYAGMNVDGDGSMLRRNRVFDTGGETGGNDVRGIWSHYSVDIVDNTVSGVDAGSNGSAWGIETDFNLSGSVSDNRVRGLVKNGTGVARGIDNYRSDRVVLRNNELVGDGLASSVGLTCFTNKGRAKDNMLKGFGTAISVCGNDGNTIRP